MTRRRVQLTLLGGFLLVYFSWLAFRWIPLENRLVGSLFFIPLNGAAAIAAWGASRRSAGVRRLRQAWLLIAMGLGAYMTGAAVAMFYEVILRVKSYPTLADPLYLTFFPLMLLGIMRFPSERRTRLRTLEIALDCLIVAIGAGAVFFYYVLGPTAVQAAGTPLETIVSAAYPIGDMVLIVGIATALLRGSLPATRRPLLLTALGLGLFAVADLIYGYMVLHSGYTTGDPVDFVYAGAVALILCAGVSQRRVGEGAHRVSSSFRNRPTWLPSVAVLLGFGVLVESEFSGALTPASILVLIAAALAVLVMARQFIAQRELISVQRLLQSAHDEMAVLATTDQLTGLANHRGFNAVMDRELAGSRRYDRPLAVLFMDVDYFKQLNDTVGHTAADAALVEFADIVQRCLRTSDVLTRWGGEEFVALLPETSPAGAEEAAERICRTVANHLFLADDSARLTCSIGIANHPSDGANGPTLLDTADRAMYIAKRLGRNRVIATGGLTPEARADLATLEASAAS